MSTEKIVKPVTAWLRDVVPARFLPRAGHAHALETLALEIEAGAWRSKLTIDFDGEIPLPDAREMRLWDAFQAVDATAGTIAYSGRQYSTVAERRALRSALEAYRRLRDEIAMVEADIVPASSRPAVR